ncbi:MAG: NAD(+)/NADH kinase [Deltaproteobacteria bacterium]
MRINRVGIFTNKEKPMALTLRDELQDWLINRSITVTFFDSANKTNEQAISNIDLFVVLGGDGTLLEATRLASKANVPIVGINLGGLGYMTEINANEMLSAMESILNGSFSVQKRMMLDVSSPDTKTFSALNDIVINRGSLASMVEIETFIDDNFLTTFKSDGLIIATPTGSTAYSLSAGGPIVEPHHNCIIINPICPHTLTNRPIIFSPDVTIRLRICSEHRSSILLVDGRESFEVNANSDIIIKKSPNEASLVASPFNNYFEILRSKLAWSVLPKRPEH